jgi:aspartate/methionine/tyrosine aminotransferase
VVEADRTALSEFLAAESHVAAAHADFGTTAFLRVVNGNAETLLQCLRQEYETTVVPGRFFEMPNHFRIGMGVNSEMFAEGLRRIRMALAS